MNKYSKIVHRIGTVGTFPPSIAADRRPNLHRAAAGSIKPPGIHEQGGSPDRVAGHGVAKIAGQVVIRNDDNREGPTDGQEGMRERSPDLR